MVVEKETKLSCALHCFCSFFCSSKEKERKRRGKKQVGREKPIFGLIYLHFLVLLVQVK